MQLQWPNLQAVRLHERRMVQQLADSKHQLHQLAGNSNDEINSTSSGPIECQFQRPAGVFAPRCRCYTKATRGSALYTPQTFNSQVSGGCIAAARIRSPEQLQSGRGSNHAPKNWVGGMFAMLIWKLRELENYGKTMELMR